MKIVHISDVHLGSALTARLSPAKIRERKTELINTFERCIEEATYRGAELFIIAGDLFDTEKVPRSVKEAVLSAIARASDIDFLYLPGNHERLTLFDGSVNIPENLKLFAEDWTYFDYGYVTVAGRSELSRDMFSTLSLDKDKKNIVVLHGCLADRSSNENVGIKDAEGRGIDYLALGHYHSYSKTDIDTRGVAVYSGTPEGRGFDETGKCGFALIDTDGSRLGYSFVPIAKREHRIIEVDISSSLERRDVDNSIASALAGIPGSDIVRVVLTGRHAPELMIDTDTLLMRYSGSYYHLEIKDESGIYINPDDYKNDKSLKGEFIRLVMSRDGLSERERNRIIMTGLGALLGDLGDV
jgi:DNA repair exonuclease SbcCD nuclease subunit